MKRSKLGVVSRIFGLLTFLVMLGSCAGVPVLDPQGPIGSQEKFLILISIGLMLIVVVPVFVMAVWFAVRYRESNTKASYKPHWEGSIVVEAFIWAVPVVIIVILSYLTWTKTAELDPYKPISSTEPTVHVQVVSLDWNWLFIYPDYGIATLNQLTIPVGRPVSFDLTSSSVMTSFFIPALGSQMYAMGGMVSHLNLLADSPGVYTGHNMEFSGAGYGAMHFPAMAIAGDEFDAWTKSAKDNKDSLSIEGFTELAKPQIKVPATTYASVDPGLFRHVVNLFMDGHGGAMGMEMEMEMGSEQMPVGAGTDEMHDVTTPDASMSGMDHMDHGTSAVPANPTN